MLSLEQVRELVAARRILPFDPKNVPSGSA